MNSSNKHTEHFFAGGGGLSVTATDGKDPLEAFDNLMAAIESLCPVWPPRDTFEHFPHPRL